MRTQGANKPNILFAACCYLKSKNPSKCLMEILKYLMKFHTVSLYWYNHHHPLKPLDISIKSRLSKSPN